MAAVVAGWAKERTSPGKSPSLHSPPPPRALKVTIRIRLGRKAEVVLLCRCAVVRGSVGERGAVHVARWSGRLRSRPASLRPVIFALDLTSPGRVAGAYAEFQTRYRVVHPCYAFNYSLSNYSLSN